MYVEKTDTYTCDFCGHNAKWDASDDVHGELWSCEAEGCGKVFCSKCFISAFGQKIYMTMMQSGENVLCPDDLPRMRCLVDGRELHPPERHVSEWDADGNRPLR